MELIDFVQQLDLQSFDLFRFSEGFKEVAWVKWQPIAARIEAIKTTLDPAIWLVGSVLALVPGSYAIYKWWHFRDSRLPMRLNEMLARDESRLRPDARFALLQAAKSPSAKRVSVTPPIFAAPALKSTIRNLNWSGWRNPFPFATAERELEVALNEIEKQLAFGERSRENSRKQQAVAYIVKGAIAAARAGQPGITSESAEQCNRAALYDFSRALEIDNDDVEALEYLAHQQRVLGQDGPALSSYERLINLTVAPGSEAKLVTARAHRYIGEILENQFETSRINLRLTNAKQRLDSAFDALPAVAMGQIDHAAIREIQGRLAEKVGAIQLPETRYNQALSIYMDIKDRNPKDLEAFDGFNRVKQARQNFTQNGPGI
jgi:tetratricopeptide (TPR) repeat protein